MIITKRLLSFVPTPLKEKYISKRKKHIMKNKNNMIVINGEKTIVELENILSKTNLFFFFDMGTLLGLVREGHILAHDMDIDIGIKLINSNDLTNIEEKLKQNGCKKRFEYTVEGLGVIEQSYVLNGIKFDINLYNEYEDMDCCYLMYVNPDMKYPSSNVRSVVRLTSPVINDRTTISAYNTLLHIPENAEQYLEARYGKQWRIPDKNYIYWKGPSATPISALGKKITYEK